MNAPGSTRPVAALPYWHPYSDHTDEALHDRWQEFFDPENCRGEAVLAHYAVTSQERGRADDPTRVEWAEWRDLLGVEIVSLTGTRWMDRAALVQAGITCHDLDGWMDQ